MTQTLFLRDATMRPKRLAMTQMTLMTQDHRPVGSVRYVPTELIRVY